MLQLCGCLLISASPYYHMINISYALFFRHTSKTMKLGFPSQPNLSPHGAPCHMHANAATPLLQPGPTSHDQVCVHIPEPTSKSLQAQASILVA